MNQREKEEAVKFILDNIQSSRDIKSKAYLVRNYLIDLTLTNYVSEDDFYRISSLLTSQARSPLWEKYFIKKHHCKKVTAQGDRGDFIKEGRHYEFKASGFNQNKCINIVQIRLWQDCDYVIQSISDNGAVTFILTHKQMKEETIAMRANSAHGTKSAILNNANVELRFSVVIESDDWNRWLAKYRVKSEDIFQ